MSYYFAMYKFLPTLLVLLLLISGCATNPVTGEQDLVLMSEQEEIALGRQTHQEVLQQYKVYEDPDLQAYVQSVGEQLAAKSHRSDLIYRFTVLDSKEVNAFALPGGYIYITRGLMAYLNSEAELAAVLGHEIGHVTARHSVRQYSAAQAANVGLIIGSILTGVGQTGAQLGQIFGTVLLRGYGREHELEADQLGAEYLARSNYDPQAMMEVIRVLKNQEELEKKVAKAEGREPNIYHGLFATHPDNDTRLKETIASAEKHKSSAATLTGRETYLHKIDGMIFGDSPYEGIVRGRNFYHPDLGIAMQLPAGWHVRNLPTQLLAISPEGKATLQVEVMDINKRISPKEFIATRLNIKELGSGTALTIHGNEAYTGIATINNKPVRVTVIYLDTRAYIFGGLCKDCKLFAKFDTQFLDTAKSFHRMTAGEQEVAKPLRIHIVQAEAGTTYSQLAKNSPLKNFPEEQLRLINDMFPTGQPQTGALLKLLQ